MKPDLAKGQGARFLPYDKQWVAIDYSVGILKTLQKSVTCSPEQRQIATDMLERWNNEDYRPTPDELSKTMKQNGITDHEVLELLEDHKHYMKTGEHRRLNVWVNKRSWTH